MGDQDAGLKGFRFSVKVPTSDEALAKASKALHRIAWILASPDWSVGMLGDIAEIVVESGHKVEMHEEYVHH